MKDMEEHWLGIGKLIEECGEVLQLLGKAIPFPTGHHPDGKGSMRARLPLELADLKAAIDYFEKVSGAAISAIKHHRTHRDVPWPS